MCKNNNAWEETLPLCRHRFAHSSWAATHSPSWAVLRCPQQHLLIVNMHTEFREPFPSTRYNQFKHVSNKGQHRRVLCYSCKRKYFAQPLLNRCANQGPICSLTKKQFSFKAAVRWLFIQRSINVKHFEKSTTFMSPIHNHICFNPFKQNCSDTTDSF